MKIGVHCIHKIKRVRATSDTDDKIFTNRDMQDPLSYNLVFSRDIYHEQEN